MHLISHILEVRKYLHSVITVAAPVV